MDEIRNDGRIWAFKILNRAVQSHGDGFLTEPSFPVSPWALCIVAQPDPVTVFLA